MRTLVHLSDLHFGRTDPELVAAVRTRVRELNPDIVAISGDLTQRARRWQFKAARDFLDTLPGQIIVVPGNHDVPLWNLFARFFFPLASYRRYITRDLAPFYDGGEVIVVGINTARSLAWKGGRISVQQADTARAQLCRFDDLAVKIVVTHHPFELAETDRDRKLVGRARMAMEKLAECGADVLLAGHLHEAYTGGTAKRYQISGHSALVVQAGTATSTRLRNSANSFNLLHIDAPRVGVQILSWNPGARQFTPSESKLYEHRPGVGFERRDG